MSKKHDTGNKKLRFFLKICILYNCIWHQIKSNICYMKIRLDKLDKDIRFRRNCNGYVQGLSL